MVLLAKDGALLESNYCLLYCNGYECTNRKKRWKRKYCNVTFAVGNQVAILSCGAPITSHQFNMHVCLG